ncbi:MAG: D-alanine--D-alanine ligase [Phycisphaerales bacterium]|nr:D-alanine--D-alanine ligase [Phycisphaerales bacterium]
MTSVLILGGGLDAERQVSIDSANGVHEGCLEAGLDAKLLIVDEPSVEDIRSWNTDIIFPVLHGKFGEGGQLQQRLERAGAQFVGCTATPARIAMDKLASKLWAAKLGIPTLHAAILDPASFRNPQEAVTPIKPPLVIKPVADGSSYGLYICPDHDAWMHALQDLSDSPNPATSMIEPMIINGTELTVGVIDDGNGSLKPLPIVQIAPASGTYDYQAKYERNDTVYTVSPDLADDLVSKLQNWSLQICNAIGVRHLARVDFMLDEHHQPWFLELNTMPGFTRTSLLPKAANAEGLPMPQLCKHLIDAARRQHEPAARS